MNPLGLLLALVVVAVASVLSLLVGRRMRRSGRALPLAGRLLVVIGVLLLGVVTWLGYYTLDALDWIAVEAAKGRDDLGIATAHSADEVRSLLVACAMLVAVWAGIGFQLGRAEASSRSRRERSLSDADRE